MLIKVKTVAGVKKLFLLGINFNWTNNTMFIFLLTWVESEMRGTIAAIFTLSLSQIQEYEQQSNQLGTKQY